MTYGRAEVVGGATKLMRWAALPTLILALLNAASGPTAREADLPATVAWAATGLGLIGFVAGIGLIRKAAWGPKAVLILGIVNALSAGAAFVFAWAGASIGLGLSLAAIVMVLTGYRPVRK